MFRIYNCLSNLQASWSIPILTILMIDILESSYAIILRFGFSNSQNSQFPSFFLELRNNLVIVKSNSVY